MASSRKASLFALALVALAMVVARSAAADERLIVAAPEKDNLQYLAFWVAKAAGFFEREGIQVEVVVVDAKAAAPIEATLEKGDADAAILGPPAYLRMIAAKAPIVVVASLFANDPYAVVVRREVVDERKISLTSPARDRVLALKGMRIGVPPPAFGRFRSLLATQQLDIEKDVTTEVLLARDQLGAFEGKKVDGIYVATPSLEKAVASADGVVVVSLAGGEVGELANRQTNVFAVSRRMFTERRALVTAAVRAIAAAEKRIHASQGEVVDALAREFPTRDRRELEIAVRLYEPAVPQSPDVRVQDLAPALALIPESIPKPELAGIDLAPFVAPDVAITSTTTGSRSYRALAAAGVLFLVIVLGFALRRRRQRASASAADPPA